MKTITWFMDFWCVANALMIALVIGDALEIGGWRMFFLAFPAGTFGVIISILWKRSCE